MINPVHLKISSSVCIDNRGIPDGRTTYVIKHMPTGVCLVKTSTHQKTQPEWIDELEELVKAHLRRLI